MYRNLTASFDNKFEALEKQFEIKINRTEGSRMGQVKLIPGPAGPCRTTGRKDKGDKGNDGLGLHFKSFAKGNSYQRGDYVFSESSRADGQTSMYIAQTSHKFRAENSPEMICVPEI